LNVTRALSLPTANATAARAAADVFVTVTVVAGVIAAATATFERQATVCEIDVSYTIVCKVEYLS
jgi:hypothetical protein